MGKKIVYFLISFFICLNAVASSGIYTYREGACQVKLQQDTLTIENDVIRRTWVWNGGNLITIGIADKKGNTDWKASNKRPDLFLPGEATKGTNGEIKAEPIAASRQYCKHTRITLSYRLGELEVQKILKLYDDTPVISNELYLKGKASRKWLRALSNPADLQNIEKLTASTEGGKVPTMEQLVLPGLHWRIEAVEFYDITDRFNTLTHSVKALSYKDCLYRGNILFAENMENEAGFFMLKEAPTSNVQLCYPNGDFLVGSNSFQMIGLGIDSVDIKPTEWTRAYGYTTGLFQSGERNKLSALRKYQMQIRPLLPDRDQMVMLNTWGDRGQDTRVNEAFCLKELELAARLGITHFQIDDGWQAGRSANSAYGGSFKNIWDNPNYWRPDPVRFPNGLNPVVKKGKELGIEVCLWFNPSIQKDYADWEKDADALIWLYKTYGIRTFKIDGTSIPNKLSEERLRKLYDTVMEATDWNVVLNLDATAMRRGGYFFFNEYGNIFLENRYTDWRNYYPYWTLRNLWMLSRFVPSQGLQIEFLNKWRNGGKYGNDIFAPSNYSFDYLFAITMAAQPLAWFEAANLPEEAFATGDIIGKYKKIRDEFHQGYIFPVGEEPSGKSWTGFQSLCEDKGYILLFRENTPEQTCEINCFFEEGDKVEFIPVMGKGKQFNKVAGKKGVVAFTLDTPNSFVLYSYTLTRK